MSSINSNTPNTSYVPDNYSAQLTNLADEINVAVGPGGASVTTPRDQLIAPSQQGIQNSQIFSNLPMLPHAEQIRTDTINNPILQFLLNFPQLFSNQPSEDVFVSEAKNRVVDDEDSNPLQFIQEAIKDYSTDNDIEIKTQASDSPVISNDQTLEEIESLTQSWIDELLKLAAGKDTISPDAAKIVKGMGSTNPQEIASTLIDLSGILTQEGISPEDKEVMLAKFNELASVIAKKNENGGAFLLNITLSEIITSVFAGTLNIAEDPSLTPEQKELLATLLNNSAKGISEANYENIAFRKEASPEFKILNGDDPAAIEKLITPFFTAVDMSKLTQSEKAMVDKAIGALSEKIAKRDFPPEFQSRLQSNNPDIIKEALSSLLGDMDGEEIPRFVQQLIINQIIPSISNKMAGINEIELKEKLKSSEPSDIEYAMSILSGVAHDGKMPPMEKKIVVDYLKVLCQALAFMAQIRSLITKLEGAFTQALAAAKMTTTSEQVKLAITTMENKLQEIMTKYIDNKNKIRFAEVMKYLMPIISVLLLVVALIVLIVSLVAAIPTGGASAAIGVAVVAKIIALVVAIAVTTAVLVFTIVDTIVSWATNKAIIEHILDACEVKDSTARTGITMGINVALIVVTAVTTLGVGLIGGIATMASKGVEMSLRALMMTILELLKAVLKQLFSGPIGAQVLGMIMGAVFSSGFIQDILVKFFKACGCDDEKAMIATMVIMVIVMIMMMVATLGKSAVGGLKIGGTTVSEAIKQVTSTIKQGIENALKNVFEFLKKILESLKVAIPNIVKNVQEFSKLSMTDQIKQIQAMLNEMMKKIADALKQLATDMKEFFKTLPETISTKANDLGTALLDKAKEVKQSVTDKIGEIQKGLTQLGNDIKTEFEKLKNEAQLIKEYLGGKIEELVKKISQFAADAQRNIGDKIEALGKKVGDIKELASQATKSIGDQIDTMIKSLSDVKNQIKLALERMKEAIEEAINELLDFIKLVATDPNTAFTQVKNQIVQDLKSIKDFIVTATESLIDQLESLPDTLKNAMIELKKSIDDAIKEMNTLLKTAKENIKDILNDAALKINEAFGKVKEVLESAIDKVKEIPEKISDMRKQIDDKYDDISKQFDDMRKNVSSVTSGPERSMAAQLMGNIVNNSLTTIESILKRFLAMADIALSNPLSNPMRLVQGMQLITAGLQIAAQAVTADSARQRAEASQDLARLAREGAALEALFEYLKTVGKIGPQTTMEALNQSAQDMFEDWKKLVNLVARFILDASGQTTAFHNRAG